METRAAIIQTGFGVFYPFLLGPLASFMFATRHFTYRLPSITTEPKEVFKLWMKLSKSASTTGTIFLVLNMFAAILITSKQITEHHRMNANLARLEENLND